MHFEDLLEEIGSFGLYQKLLCFFLIPFTTGICAFTFYSQIFILTAPFHLCPLLPPDGLVDGYNVTANLLPREIQFLDKVSTLINGTLYNSADRNPYACNQFELNGSLAWTKGTNWIANLSSLQQVPPPTKHCVNGWEYDTEHMFSTYTSEHNFVCEDSWRPYLVATVFWVGNTIGSWVFGFISDTYGRRLTILLSHLIYGVAGVASVYVSDFYGFMMLRVMVGFAHHTVTHLPFVLVVEYCGLDSRTVPLLTIMMTYTIGSIMTPILAWFLWDWRTLAVVTSAPALIIFLVYWWIPESSSWLIARGKEKAARKQLETVAKVNNKKVPYEMLTQLLADTKVTDSDQLKTEEDKNVPLQKTGEGKTKKMDVENTRSSILHVLRYSNLRRNVLMVLVVWMLSCMCYFGHCQNTAKLGSNIFLSYILGAAVEIPAWTAPYLINRFGRRKPLIFAYFIAGVSSLLYSVLPQDSTWLVLVMALLGRASITAAYYITLQYGPEVFPTVIRGQGVAMSETLGGVAIFLSPSIVYLGEFHKTAPLLVFGGLSILGALVTLLLPETAGVALPQTLPQAELFARKSGIPIPCWSNPGVDADDKSDETQVVHP